MKNADVISALETDMYRGLSEREAERRRRKYGANGIWRVKRMSALTAVYESIFDISTLLLIISAASAAIFDESGTAMAVAVILVLAGILRSVVYIRANRILEDMAQGFVPVATVIRDGHMKLLSANELVVGDVIFLEAGSTVPCDGRIIAGEDSVVGERGITENNTPRTQVRYRDRYRCGGRRSAVRMSFEYALCGVCRFVGKPPCGRHCLRSEFVYRHEAGRY